MGSVFFYVKKDARLFMVILDERFSLCHDKNSSKFGSYVMYEGEDPMAELFDEFPYLTNDYLIIRKMTVEDVPALSQISHNEQVYRYIPMSFYKKNDRFLETAIGHLGGRDFVKKKQIIAGIYLQEDPTMLVGLAEMFDYKKRENKITVGYRLNENYWNRQIATHALALMKEYLLYTVGLSKLQAFVMPENIPSAKVLLKNGFQKEDVQVEEHNWGGRENLLVDVYSCVRDEEVI